MRDFHPGGVCPPLVRLVYRFFYRLVRQAFGCVYTERLIQGFTGAGVQAAGALSAGVFRRFGRIREFHGSDNDAQKVLYARPGTYQEIVLADESQPGLYRPGPFHNWSGIGEHPADFLLAGSFFNERYYTVELVLYYLVIVFPEGV